MSLRSRSWHQGHTFENDQFTAPQLAAGRDQSVSICLPARDEAATIGPILDQLLPLIPAGVVDQVVVIDGSSDETAAIARTSGATVYDERQLLPELGPVLGKGDAMWRALTVLTGDVVCFLDADSEEFGEHYVYGMLGPLLTDPECQFVKGFYRRPFRIGDVTVAEGGGRVTELTARPLLNLFYPDLATVLQPLAGEVAGRRSLWEQLPFSTGYGVDIGLLIDAYDRVGLDAISQVNLGVRQNQHQPLRDLGVMAFEVLQAVSARLERSGRLSGQLPTEFLVPAAGTDADTPQAGVPTPTESRVIERPPLARLRAAA